ncbi:MAG TPA: DeoR family transcriptional regulator [Candidatus Paceibacterota bacterium]|nr:DeoR family transcriptional regulator [Candidatus Paceibacterota bacterium]
MRHNGSHQGHDGSDHQLQSNGRDWRNGDFVLEKTIFNNVFEKDIRKVYIYKKAERLAKALHLITPAFSGSLSLRNRADAIAIGLVDAAIQPSGVARTALSRELLALSSVLSIARTGGLLSAMNADLIAREAQSLLQEVAGYEEPRLLLEETPTLAEIARETHRSEPSNPSLHAPHAPRRALPAASKGHVKDTAPAAPIKDRREGILSIIREKGQVSIKDISTLIRGVSEKTVQRELAALISSGAVRKHGERRWSVYSLAH